MRKEWIPVAPLQFFERLGTKLEHLGGSEALLEKLLTLWHSYIYIQCTHLAHAVGGPILNEPPKNLKRCPPPPPLQVVTKVYCIWVHYQYMWFSKECSTPQHIYSKVQVHTIGASCQVHAPIIADNKEVCT